MTSLDLHTSLQHTFGFDEFRTGQQQVIENLLNGHSTLAIFPTGSGKSLCYQFTALHLPHLTLVISPLLALMKDQLDFLQLKGIPAARIDSSMSYEQNQQIMGQIRQGQLKILMVSVERFKNERFRQFIESVPVSMLVVDEAHCISEWGHNFRPDYLKLPVYQKALNAPLALLLTATATSEVSQDIASKFAVGPHSIVQTGFYRANLQLQAIVATAQHKDALLIDNVSAQSGAGIVYVTLQKQAEDVARLLQQQGFNAAAYHAGMADEKRQLLQQQFMQNEVDIVVATIAFGMGIDKSNIRFVIHYELPKSIEGYSQEIGRAGRDGLHANCITLASLHNLTTLENFVYGDAPELSSIQTLLQLIQQQSESSRWETQLIPLSNTTNIRQLPLKTLFVQLELMKVITPLFGYFSEFRFRFKAEPETILQLFEGERRQFLAAIFQSSPRKKIWATLDQKGLYEAYPHERGRLVKALDYLHEKNQIELHSKGHTDVYQVDEQALAEPNLAELLFQYFKQKETAEIGRIEQLVDFFQSKTCLSQRLAGYFDDNSLSNPCGHCSVCLSGPIVLPGRNNDAVVPEQQRINQIYAQLSALLEKKLMTQLTPELFSRFLAGMTSPYLTKIKAKSVAGFGLYEAMRYRDIFPLAVLASEAHI
ncbi:RecQ family ATP-dependent DNA helicase [Aliiglaciecola sp. LCG003]|uniref:RecQ family ATP-dependent DNA helicase n=1 Tax=Aliiglaciecola sp. LCG003 TaxID=3053655 RepID=UPI0025726F04|nr:RecQ family ATP-dependent DNA helicase [Aliiglaciecola sp. LCG003]WJG09996.1 RecQ family ATP-dependent DNA helicase [Aliiglaciecola sp. LCG003]